MNRKKPLTRHNLVDFEDLLRQLNVKRGDDLQKKEDAMQPVPTEPALTVSVPNEQEDTADEKYQKLIAPLVQAVKSPPLSELLASVLQEQWIRLTVTTGKQIGNATPIDALHGAAEIARWLSPDPESIRAPLFVATVLRGIQEMLASQVVGNSCTSSQALLTMVRTALHQLDEQDPSKANLVRLILGWGNEDEIDAVYIPRLQQDMLRALMAVELIDKNPRNPMDMG
jgi:hypothetical protein